MHHISKNWEPVFDFQYKVVVGQCVLLTDFVSITCSIFNQKMEEILHLHHNTIKSLENGIPRNSVGRISLPPDFFTPGSCMGLTYTEVAQQSSEKIDTFARSL